MVSNVDKVNKYLSRGSSLPQISRHDRHVTQAPPIQAGDLAAFQTTARGTANVLVPAEQQKKTLGTAPGKKLKSLDDVWEKAIFGKAGEVKDIKVEELNKVDPATGKMKVARYQPERFERGKVQRPHMVVEEVEAAMLHDDGTHVMHPKVRRTAHDASVNIRQAELELREALRIKGKLMKTCAMNYPHGALGVKDSPYEEEDDSLAYRQNAATLRAQNQAAVRKSKGGKTPACTIGTLLQHDANVEQLQKEKTKK